MTRPARNIAACLLIRLRDLASLCRGPGRFHVAIPTTADAGAAVAEWIAVLCHSYGNGAETCVTGIVNLQSTVDVDLPASAVSAIAEPAADDVGLSPALHFVDAIKVEITQSRNDRRCGRSCG
jgi:hypothetical protein